MYQTALVGLTKRKAKRVTIRPNYAQCRHCTVAPHVHRRLGSGQSSVYVLCHNAVTALWHSTYTDDWAVVSRLCTCCDTVPSLHCGTARTQTTGQWSVVCVRAVPQCRHCTVAQHVHRRLGSGQPRARGSPSVQDCVGRRAGQDIFTLIVYIQQKLLLRVCNSL